jgi:hypothetical protein
MQRPLSTTVRATPRTERRRDMSGTTNSTPSSSDSSIDTAHSQTVLPSPSATWSHSFQMTSSRNVIKSRVVAVTSARASARPRRAESEEQAKRHAGSNREAGHHHGDPGASEHVQHSGVDHFSMVGVHPRPGRRSPGPPPS